MTLETIVTGRPEAEEEDAAVEAIAEVEEAVAEEDFNPLGEIEGWSAFECSSGPFGDRG